VFERREIATLAKLEFLLEVAGEIVVPRELNGWTERCVGLNKNVARCFAATRPSGDLREQLKRAFAGAEVGKMEGKIGIDDPDQSHVREMKTFGDHLRTNQDVDLAGAKISQSFAVSFFSSHRIGVHPAHVRFGK